MKMTCPWCGYQEIEPETQEEEGGTITLLAECEVCGAEQLDPAELDSATGHKDGWQVSGPKKMWNIEKHGPLKEGQGFAICYGDKWAAFTEKGFLVYLPLDHELVQNSLNSSAEKARLRG